MGKFKTCSQSLNEDIGRKVFAECLDEYGLPMDGGWALPVMTETCDSKQKTVTFSVGSFGLKNGQLVREVVEQTFSEKTLRAMTPAGSDIHAIKNDLLARLVKKIESRRSGDYQ